MDSSVMTSAKPSIRTGKGVKRNFLKKDTINEIIKLSKRMSPKDIAAKFHLSNRHVNDIIRLNNKNQVNVFSPEEDKALIHYYHQGYVKPSELSKLMPTKAPWMIRNRIKVLKNRMLIDDTQIPMIKPDSLALTLHGKTLKNEATNEEDRTMFWELTDLIDETRLIEQEITEDKFIRYGLEAYMI